MIKGKHYQITFKLMCFLLCLLLSTIALTKPITIVTNDDNPPFSFTLPDKTVTGLYVEFWHLWDKHNEQSIQISLRSLNDSLEDVKQLNAVHSGLFKSNARSQWADFTLPIHSVDTGLLLSRNHPKTTKLSNLDTTALIAVQENSFQAEYLKSKYPNLKLIHFTDPDIIFNKLLSNEIDALVAEIPFIKAELSKLGLNGVLSLSEDLLMSNTVHGMAAKGQTDLLKTLNSGIANIPINEIIALEKKWLPTLQPYFKNEKEVAFLTTAENQWLNTHRNFSLGIDTSWYPFDFTDEKGQFIGIAADYIRYLSNTLGVNFSPQYENKWTTSFKLFKQEQIDIMSGVIATDERKKTIDFTQAYFKAPTVIVTKKDSFYVEDMKDIKGKKLGLVKGFAVVELVRNDYPDIQIKLVDSIIQGLTELQNGTIDAYLGTLAVVNYEIDRNNFDEIKIAAFAPYKFEISMAVRKGLEPLVNIFNKAFDNMSEKQKATIANNWLAVHIATGTNIKTVLKWGLPILAILMMIIIIIIRFNKTLQGQIKQRKLAEKELQHLAEHDSLTGLPNWRNFESQFNNTVTSDNEYSHAILFLDLDGFKHVNDTLGHPAGDAILIETAQRLQSFVKHKGSLARIGGDEFVILVEKTKDRKQIQTYSQSIIELVSKELEWQGKQVLIGTSIGIAIYPDDSIDLNELVKFADSAMYKAKELGKNNYQFY